MNRSLGPCGRRVMDVRFEERQHVRFRDALQNLHVGLIYRFVSTPIAEMMQPEMTDCN